MTTSFINKTVNSMLFAYGLVNRDINNFELKIHRNVHMRRVELGNQC